MNRTVQGCLGIQILNIFTCSLSSTVGNCTTHSKKLFKGFPLYPLLRLCQSRQALILLCSGQFVSLAVGRRDVAVVVVLASHCCDLGWIPRPCVTCGSSLSGIFILAQWVFLQVLEFSSPYKNQHSKFQVSLEA